MDTATSDLQASIINATKPFRDDPVEPTTVDDKAYPTVLEGFPPKEQICHDLEQRFLSPTRTLPFGQLSDAQITWTREPDLGSLLFVEPFAPATTLNFTSSGLDGRITGYQEVSNARGALLSAKASTSLQREPANIQNFVRGSSSHVPFRPGGLDIGLESELEDDNGIITAQEMASKMEEGFDLTKGGIRTVPPGFVRGLDFSDAARQLEDEALGAGEELAAVTPIYRPMLQSAGPSVNGWPGRGVHDEAVAEDPAQAAISELLPTERLRLKTSSSTQASRRRPAVAKRDWAHVVDVNKELVNFRELVPDMAKEYPFELDTFQKEAVYHLERGDSVFVAAHTSAGKTVVAEYAIALAARHMTRAIYTSPIKALSNQKFRDFKTTFPPESVGILTGDVQINPEGSCLIMTTEILRSMLYKGADLIRDVEFVIFDEVHYVNDLERGVVWEEVIIMLPDHVNIILLSATVPNTKEFADWVGRTKKKDIYVISTPKRPVPLEHFLYANREIHKIVDSKGEFLGHGWKDAKEGLRRKQEKEREAAGLPPATRGGAAAGRGGQQGGARGRGGQRAVGPRGGGTFTRGRGGFQRMIQQDRNLWVHLIALLRKKELLPVVIFTFSKKRCEENASSLTNTDLCTAAEKSEIHIVLERSLTRLKGSDKTLPQIIKMRDLLGRGIAVHHGGLLPIVKEASQMFVPQFYTFSDQRSPQIVEILFARGLVKVLFATETFAMGVNMPARCVVFSGTRKHDGQSFRDLLAGEYTQMSGRAGRRGLDSTGVVIIVCNDNEPPEVSTLTKMILGTPTKLQSQFRLTYSMILNLLRVEALRVEEMIKRSFSENASQRLLPDHQKRVLEGEKELRLLQKVDDTIENNAIRRYYDLAEEAIKRNSAVLRGVTNHPYGSKILTTGRIVILSDGHFRCHPAVILRRASGLVTSADGIIDQSQSYIVLAIVSPDVKSGARDISVESIAPRWPPEMAPDSLDGDVVYEVAAVPLASIALVTRLASKVDDRAILDYHRKSAMQTALKDAVDLCRNLSGDLLSSEANWTKLRGMEFAEAIQARNEVTAKLLSLQTDKADRFDEVLQLIHGEKVLQAKLSALRLAISDQNLELLPDYEQRIDVLKDLQFIDQNSTVLLKGRVACEINSASELVLTELILENVLASYEPQEVVALLSCFVFQEKTETEPFLTPKLQEGKETILSVAERVTKVQMSRRAEFPGEEVGKVIRFGLVEVVYEWAKGMPFDQITTLTDVAEGTIVRAITRLDETCREVRDAARVIGDADLFRKMEDCQLKIRRDIVFAASLYF